MRGAYVIATLAVLTGCASAPQPPLPQVPITDNYKEKRGDVSATSIPLAQEKWWSIYKDPELDRLEARLIANSPDLGSALARYQQARATTDTIRAARMPSVDSSLNGARNRQSERRPLRGESSPDNYSSATLALNFDYEIDLWGRVSQQVAAGVSQEQAAQADLASARLALQIQLADTVVALRGADKEISLLQETESAYARAASMAAERHRGGVASGLDLARAQAQLETAGSQLHQVQAQRALLEHAIAALVGANASSFSLEPKLLAGDVPVIPLGIPSDLLQRRPDIAAAQHRIAAANASVGVARKAYFPSVRLSGIGGYQSDDFGNFLSAPNIFWAAGPGLLVSLFDGGRRKAEIARAEAVLDQEGHVYRGVVLSAFQQVEDQLSSLNRYGEAASDEQRAVVATQRALDLANNLYRDGAVSYIEVVTAQTANLQSRRSALDLNTRQRRATVQLIRALGGGWSAQMVAAQPIQKER
ncbi:efflux transporter outer membrane subunit [Pseudomonas izuensis]|uniref:efflux transporter outer membrane subunit n=1 Tax=Pseudomonas izuensis TaxID=2684212 RepID=UPI001359AEB5|nr:efflux transporter outer membrane subunit [Pseudomonas izuensis]